MQAIVDRSAWFIADLMYQLGAANPATWLLLGAAMAVLFFVLVRPLR